MANPVLVASPVAILPAMLGVWWILRRYEGFFSEAKVFFALVVGLFVGVAAASMEAALFGFPSLEFQQQAGALASLLFTVLGYALFETGAKAVFLGMRRFRGRRDAPYYGAPLGFAMGAMMAMHHIASWVDSEAFGGMGIVGFTSMAAVPVAAVFVHGAAGAWVGQGSADGRLGRGWAIGMGLQMPALVALWFGLQSPADVLLAAAAVLYAAFAWWITRRRLLETIVPKDIRDQVRRDQRRSHRRLLRDEDQPAGEPASDPTGDPAREP